MNDKIRELILGNIENFISDFLYYDRKDDEELQRGMIEKAIEDGIISVDEIVEKFSFELRKNV